MILKKKRTKNKLFSWRSFSSTLLGVDSFFAINMALDQAQKQKEAIGRRQFSIDPSEKLIERMFLLFCLNTYNFNCFCCFFWFVILM